MKTAGYSSQLSFNPIGRWFSIICCLLYFIANPVFSAPAKHSSSQIKAAYVFNFIQYVEWPNEANIKTFNIGFYGKDQAYYHALQRMQDTRIRGFTLKLHHLPSLDNSKHLQLLIIDKHQSIRLPAITRQLARQATLVISDMAKDKKSIMLNFVSTKSKTLTFELNRYNLLNAKLKVLPDILVLGGSELDIANVLKEMDDSLASSLAELKSQSDKLTQLRTEIQTREKQLDAQQQKLSAQSQQLQHQSSELVLNKNKFSALKNDYAGLNHELENSRTQLTENTQNLHHLTDEIADKETSIFNLSTQIDKRKAALKTLHERQAQQEKAISDKEIEISQHQVEIKKQSTVIRTQYSVLIFAAITIFSVLIMAAITYHSSRAKHLANQRLLDNNHVLATVNQQLKNAQNQLVESEKMAALGGLVAGVAHEINTPLGVSVTAASHLSDRIKNFSKEYADGRLRRAALDELLTSAKESSDMLMRNLYRASELIRTFKQVAVDQSNEGKRKFKLEAYLEELIQSLRPQFKQDDHQVVIQSDESIALDSYPGVLAQVMTNLIMNSVVHGFKEKKNGDIHVRLKLSDAQVMIDYRDNGVGLSDKQREKVFEPFYTTTRGSGGSGLGMSISYNLVVRKLGGTISCMHSPLGAHFLITFPVSLQVEVEVDA